MRPRDRYTAAVRECKRIIVVVPAHDEQTQIGTVLSTMPDFVDHVIVVDDHSGDDTAANVRSHIKGDPRVELIVHGTNQGVGAAISTGYRRALELGGDVVAVMAGDGQMPPDELAGIVDPVALGECEYAKANRLASGEAWNVIPHRRFLGNAALTLMTKIASGYYGVTDSQTGFTAIDRATLEALNLDALYPRYGYPNDVLVRLNVLGARVLDVPSRPVYGVGEVSGLKISRVMFTISWLLLRRFWWRMGSRYVVRDFHPLVLFYTLGIFLLTVGVLGEVGLVAALGFGRHPTVGTAVLVSLAVSTGLLLVLFGMLFDFEANQELGTQQQRVTR